VLVLVGVSAAPVHAAWDNVFQITCFHCQKPARTSTAYYYAPAATDCCQPCQQCNTCYVQRCYYQPVTTYQTRSYYEPVTTYRTSYYYEPVTSYRYSCYYDPCTCSYQQVACPTTSYQLRSQTCAVQSWVQRCCSVPVTSYQQAFYWEPVTTCSSPVVTAAPSSGCAPTTSPPPASVTEPRPATGPGISEIPGGTSSGDRIPSQRYYPPGNDIMPGASGSSYRQPSGAPAPNRQTVPPPALKWDRITSLPAGQVQGQVVRGDNRPWAGVKILFVSADRRLPRQTASTDRDGHFQAELAPGGWLVYLQGTDDRPTFHRKIDVKDNDNHNMILVSR
jgi:hypothetical protein